MSVRLLSESTPKAAKPHVCDLCGRPILAGERYYLQRCADDGPPYSWRAHEVCWSGESRFWREVHGMKLHELDEYDAPDVGEFRAWIDAIMREAEALDE